MGSQCLNKNNNTVKVRYDSMQQLGRKPAENLHFRVCLGLFFFWLLYFHCIIAGSIVINAFRYYYYYYFYYSLLERHTLKQQIFFSLLIRGSKASVDHTTLCC